MAHFTPRNKLIFIIVSFFFLLFIGYSVWGVTILEDNFNSYTDGNLDGQGSWTNPTYYWQVAGSVTYEGAKAVYKSSAEGIATKSGTSRTAGTQCVAMRSSNTGNAFTMELKENTTNKVAIRLSETSNIQYWVGGSYTTIEAYSANTWYVLCIDFDDANQPDKARFSVDGGSSWGSWYDISGGYSYLDKVTVEVQAYAGGSMYFDTLADISGAEPEPSDLNYSMLLALILGGILVILLFDLLRRHFIME